MEVYDSSMQGCARFFVGEVNEDLGGMGYSSSSGAKGQLPYIWPELYGARGTHNNIIAHRVSAPAFCTLLECDSRRSCMSFVGYKSTAQMLPQTNSRVSGPSDRSTDPMFVTEYG